jgi:hypothetical protein
MNKAQGFFSRQDIGGNDPEKFRLSLQVANLKIINAELLEALKGMLDYPEEDLMHWISKGQSVTMSFTTTHIVNALNAIKKAKQ